MAEKDPNLPARNMNAPTSPVIDPKAPRSDPPRSTEAETAKEDKKTYRILEEGVSMRGKFFERGDTVELTDAECEKQRAGGIALQEVKDEEAEDDEPAPQPA